MLRNWLAEHGPLALAGQHHPDSFQDIFKDRFGVKLTLLEQLGILFGVGDGHVAKFFPGFLIEANDHGGRYGVEMNKISQRQELAAFRRSQIG